MSPHLYAETYECGRCTAPVSRIHLSCLKKKSTTLTSTDLNRAAKFSFVPFKPQGQCHNSPSLPVSQNNYANMLRKKHATIHHFREQAMKSNYIVIISRVLAFLFFPLINIVCLWLENRLVPGLVKWTKLLYRTISPILYKIFRQVQSIDLSCVVMLTSATDAGCNYRRKVTWRWDPRIPTGIPIYTNFFHRSRDVLFPQWCFDHIYRRRKHYNTCQWQVLAITEDYRRHPSKYLYKK